METPRALEVLETNAPDHSRVIKSPFTGQEEGALRCDGSALVTKSLEPRTVILRHEHETESGLKSHWLALNTRDRKITHHTLRGPSETNPTIYGRMLDGGVSGELISLFCTARETEGLSLERGTSHFGVPIVIRMAFVDPHELLEDLCPGRDLSELRDFSLETWQANVVTQEATWA